MNYQIRNAEPEDLARIQEIYAFARRFMAKNGNPDQWGNAYPPQDCLLQDIREKNLYVLQEEKTVHGVFYFSIGPDPTYERIYEGAWGSDTRYGTIHRIAGDGSGGILACAVSFARTKWPHLRIDTHRDNYVMQNALAKQGFHRRGIIYLEDGTDRIAYDLLQA